MLESCSACSFSDNTNPVTALVSSRGTRAECTSEYVRSFCRDRPGGCSVRTTGTFARLLAYQRCLVHCSRLCWLRCTIESTTRGRGTGTSAERDRGPHEPACLASAVSGMRRAPHVAPQGRTSRITTSDRSHDRASWKRMSMHCCRNNES